MSKQPQPQALELADNLQNTEYDYAPTGPFGQTETFYRTPNGSLDLDEAAALLRSQHQLIGELVEALSSLLDDTQHAEHADCEEGPCCVREARAVLSKAKEQP